MRYFGQKWVNHLEIDQKCIKFHQKVSKIFESGFNNLLGEFSREGYIFLMKRFSLKICILIYTASSSASSIRSPSKSNLSKTASISSSSCPEKIKVEELIYWKIIYATKLKKSTSKETKSFVNLLFMAPYKRKRANLMTRTFKFF